MFASKLKIHPSFSHFIAFLRHSHIQRSSPQLSYHSSSSSTISSSSKSPQDSENLNRINQKDWLSPNEVLKIFQPIKNPETVIAAFEKLIKRRDYKPTSSLYLLVITKLGQTKNFDAIDDLLAKIKLEKNCRLSDEFFYDVIKVYGHIGGRINTAIEILFDMPNFNVWPSIKTFNFVLNLLVSTKQYEVIHGVFMGAGKLGIEIDACCLNILIKGLCQNGDIDGAFKVFDEFPQQKCRPNSITFSTLMHGLCKKGMIDEAFKLFSKMESEQIDPDIITFNILISGLRKTNQIDEGMKLLEKMQLKGCAPNQGSYQEVLYGLIDVYRYVEAKELMCRMISKGICPSFVSYKMLIDGLCKDKLIDDACWILRQMVEQGFVPKMGMWRQLLRGIFSRIDSNSHHLVMFTNIIDN